MLQEAKHAPNYQFHIWVTLDDKIGYFGIWKTIFDNFLCFIYGFYSLVILILPIVILYVCGRRTFYFYIKCSLFAYIIGFLIFIIFPCYNYRYYDWFKGGNYKNIPSDFKYGFINVSSFPSFHCLMALNPIIGLFFIKMENKPIVKKVYIPTLIFVLVYYSFLYISTITNPIPHYFLDGWIAVGICIFSFLTLYLIWKQKNGIWLSEKVNKVYLFFTTTNRIKTRCFCYIALVVIFIFFLGVIIFATYGDCKICLKGEIF